MWKTQWTQASGWDKQQRGYTLIMDNSLWQNLINYIINYNYRATSEVAQTLQDLSNCSFFMKVLQVGLFYFWTQQSFGDTKNCIFQASQFYPNFPIWQPKEPSVYTMKAASSASADYTFPLAYPSHVQTKPCSRPLTRTMLFPWSLSKKDSVLPSLNSQNYFRENKPCICPLLFVLQPGLFIPYAKMLTWRMCSILYFSYRTHLSVLLHQTRELLFPDGFLSIKWE